MVGPKKPFVTGTTGGCFPDPPRTPRPPVKLPDGKCFPTPTVKRPKVKRRAGKAKKRG